MEYCRLKIVGYEQIGFYIIQMSAAAFVCYVYLWKLWLSLSFKNFSVIPCI
jgi:hypothetical protein